MHDLLISKFCVTTRFGVVMIRLYGSYLVTSVIPLRAILYLVFDSSHFCRCFYD